MEVMSASIPEVVSDEHVESTCSVCGKKFTAIDPLVFVCRDCQNSLPCDCGNQDVSMDWGVNTETEKPYFWVIECSCGHSMRSSYHNIDEQDQAAKQLYKDWMTK